MVYIRNGEALIVSTPDSDDETQHLIDWVSAKAQVVGYVIDRWHPDAMEGLDVVHANGIASYSSERTRRVAQEKGLPVPTIGFSEQLEIDVGDQRVICHFLGEAHTADGIVVWIPHEKILFGGNGIRSNNSWLGNIADAHLNDWSTTAQRVKDQYGHARFVIPGHGKHGGPELIDYTIDLYNFPKNTDCEQLSLPDSLYTASADAFHFACTDREQHAQSSTYLHASVSFEKTGRQFEIRADSITYSPSKKSIYVPDGCIQLKEENQSVSFHFNQLYGTLRDDEVELTLIIKEVKQR